MTRWGINTATFNATATGAVRTATDLTSRVNLARFVLGGVLLAPAVLVVALGLFDFLTGRPFTATMAQRIFIGHALGMAVMSPVSPWRSTWPTLPSWRPTWRASA